MLPSQRDAKSASEYPRTLAQSLELDYFRRPRSMRRLRRRVFAAVFLSSIAVIVILTFLPRNRSIYEAGPVSSAHAMFNDECARCHTLKFSPLERLVRGDEGVRSVTDAACLRCHDAPIHHQRQLVTPACASCHREHRGQQSLARVGEGQCIECHADLKKHVDTRKSSDSDRSFRDVSGFASGLHPQFALWDNPKDPGTIRFNHMKHLNPAGVSVADSRELLKLECAHCHQPDEDHRYMLPINYDRHCGLCHPLLVPIVGELTDPELRKAAEGFLKVPAPHPKKGEKPATVRAVVRDRLIAFIGQHPSVIQSEKANALARPIPGRGLSRPVIESEGAWVERQVQDADRFLFKSAGRCRYCHTETTDLSHRAMDLPEYALPMIKDRWLPHSVFSHDSHRALTCQECHAGVSKSELTSQVLMPKIGSCQECHNSRRKGARSDCVECHAYHDRRKEYRLDGQFSIADFLEFVPESKARKSH